MTMHIKGMTMTDSEMIKELEAYAMANYDKGGHWIVECWEDSDYQGIIDEMKTLEKCKKALKSLWNVTNERESNCMDY
jgi:hypothetical protein